MHKQKKIRSAPSPNFDERKLPISILVLHYTGMKDGASALARLRDKDAKVSAHYLIEEDGDIFQMVDEDKRAWHAGVSSWNGIIDINSASIGIEIVNGGHDYGLPDFPDIQIGALLWLCKDIMERNDIKSNNVVGHSDVAPGRKIDPGEKFPWHLLAAEQIGYWPQSATKDQRVLFASADRDRGISAVQSGLAGLGYGAEVTGIMDEKTTATVEAFQRRFRPSKIDGKIDVQTLDIIAKLSEMREKV